MEKNLELIYEELISVFHDIRAEVIVSEILESSKAELSDFTIHNSSNFKRPFRRDILDHKNSLSSVNDYTLNLNLSRNGIYDSLPEGVFHDSSSAAFKGLTYQKKREKQKNEEKEARKFFQPIENEIFNQYVAIEKTERKLINRFSDIQNKFLLDFWKIDTSLPSEFVMRLIKLLPYVHKISGNLELTALCLQNIIGEKVTMTKTTISYSHTAARETQHQLGVNMVLEVEESTILCPAVEVNIGPVKTTSISRFVNGTPWMRFLELFYEYFLPMEMEARTIINSSPEDSSFVLNDTEPALMGLNTSL